MQAPAPQLAQVTAAPGGVSASSCGLRRAAALAHERCWDQCAYPGQPQPQVLSHTTLTPPHITPAYGLQELTSLF